MRIVAVSDTVSYINLLHPDVKKKKKNYPVDPLSQKDTKWPYAEAEKWKRG